MKLSSALRIQRGDVVALVGGGGKTSVMFRLGDELAAQGWCVVTTTSTHIGADQVGMAPYVILQPTDELTISSLPDSPTLLVGAIDPRTNKAAGLGPGIIDRILPELGADVVINEADGARMLPFKAPADHEPAIPSSTTLVVLTVGIDVVGQPLDGAHVHRPERVAALTGAEWGQPVTPEMIAGVLTHPQGGLKGVPPRARVVALINKVETEAQVEASDRVADLLLEAPRVEGVAMGAVQRAEPVRRVKSRVAVVVLAAGESRRFGRLKQLEPWGDGTLLTHVVEVALASQARQVIVVLGCQAEACRAALSDASTGSAWQPQRPLSIVVNPDWTEGQSTSVRAGLAALEENVGGVIFHLADQPGVTAEVMDALIERHASTLAPVVWPEYQGRRGNPVLFDRVAFAELEKLSGDVGGKPVLLAYARANAAERVVVEEPGVMWDIDSPRDLTQG